MRKLNYPLFFIVLVNLFFLIFAFSQKKDLLLDEIFSFGHANSSTYAYLFSGVDSELVDTQKKAYNKWLKPNFFFEYMSVQDNEKFLYSHIVKNLSQGVHPPLFHMMLHSISSLFPNQISFGFGYALNLPIWVLFLFMVYKLALYLFPEDKKLAYAALVFCSFSLFALNMAIFVRMYLLWMCLSTMFIYFSLKLLQNEMSLKKGLVLIFCLCVLCFWSHFYALPLVFFVTLSTSIFLVVQKKWKMVFAYGMTVIVALFFSYCCFSYMLKAIFISVRGQEIRDTAFSYQFNIFEFLPQWERFFDLIFYEIFNFDSIQTIWGILFFLLASVWIYMQKRDDKRFFIPVWWMLSFAVPMAIFLVVLSPDMGWYDDRYFAPLLVVFSLLIVFWLNALIETFCKNKTLKFAVLFSLIVFNLSFLNFFERSHYLLSNSSYSFLIKKMQNKPVLVCGNSLDVIYNLAYFAQKTQGLYFFQKYDDALYREFNQLSNGYLLIFSGIPSWKNLQNVSTLPIMKKIRTNLEFVGKFQIGAYFYDVYKIRKIIPKTA